MKHTFEQRIFYADTDSYGVVWHGSYLRLMEMGRVYWTEAAGFNLNDLKENHDIVIPVAGVNIRYKNSAKVDDVVIVETELSSYNGIAAVFKQIIKNSFLFIIRTLFFISQILHKFIKFSFIAPNFNWKT